MDRWFALVVIALVVALPAHARPRLEQVRIEFLISAVADLRDAVFVRNGNEYPPSQAAEHLRRKLSHAGDRVGTADQFIERCASASWSSGKRYTIRYRDGRTLDVAAWLREKLSQPEAP